jgi:hypothetical protein
LTVTEASPPPRSAGRPPRRVDIDLVIRIVAALLASGAICGLALTLYPDELSVSTDIVGYPIFRDFNSGRYTFEYLLIVVAFPAIAIAAFSTLEVLARRRAGRTAMPALPTAAVADPPAPIPAAAAASYGKAAAVGLLIAVAIAIAAEASSSWPLLLALPVTVAYVLLSRGIALAVARSRGLSIDNALSALNAVAASAALLAVAVASAATHVRITGPGLSVDYPIAPAWVLVVAALIPVAVVCRVLWRTPAERWPRVEGWTLMVVVAPAFIYLGLAFIRGDHQPPLDFFHDGERVGASHLVLDAGRFPWRDLLFIHGLQVDVLFPGLDMAAVEHSRWGWLTGQALLERPLFWISTFALCIYLFRRNPPFLVGVVLLLVLGWLDPLDYSRMTLVPPSLLALAALLARSTWPRAIAFMAVTGAQAILAPEATGFSVAAWAVVIAYELVHRRLPDAEGLRASRSLRSVVAGGALLAAFAVFLAANDSIDGFVSYYTTFVSGHGLSGAFPIQWTDTEFRVWVYIPVAVVLIAWAYAAARFWMGRWLTRADWVVAAAVLGLVPYYLKFLARPDTGHLYEVATVAAVPALYIVYRVVQTVDARARRTRRPLLAYRPATLALLVVVVVLAPGSALTTFRDLPGHYVGTASALPTDPRLGYGVRVDYAPLIRRVQEVVDRYAPDGAVFDFTNSPLLFSYLVDDRPATRFFHVSMAIPAEAQRHLVDELRDEDPPLVAYSSREHGLPTWDGISNPVRHYLVSDYLLDHYHPVAQVEDYVFMARDRDPSAPPLVRHPSRLLFAGVACDWGYAPNFLDQSPPAGATTAPLGITDLGASFGVRGWAVDTTAERRVKRVLIVNGRRVIATVPTGLRRDDVAAALDSQRVRYSGFESNEQLPARSARAPGALTYFGLTRSGVAGPFGTSRRPPATLTMPDGSTVAVDAGSVRGSIDEQLAPMDRYRLEPPNDFRDFDWLSVNAEPAPEGSEFVVSDGSGAGSRAIAFTSLAGRDSLRVRVGACPQWKGYSDGPLYLDVTPGTGPPEANLIR